VPDPILGQAIKAFVVLDADKRHPFADKNHPDVELTEKDILRHCQANLENFMVPQYVKFCDELPKTASGKIKKTDLR